MANLSYGAFHKIGKSVSVNSTEVVRHRHYFRDKEPFAGCNASFFLSADAYTNYKNDDWNFPAFATMTIGCDEKNLRSANALLNDDNGYDVKTTVYYTGYGNNYTIGLYINPLPKGYIATANAYLQWND